MNVCGPQLRACIYSSNIIHLSSQTSKPMDAQTYESFDLRLKTLELEAGDADDVSLVVKIGHLQAKMNKLYQDNPELATLDQITKELKLDHKRPTAKSASVSDAEKQELVLIKYPEIMKAYQNLMELLSVELPLVLAELSGKLDTQPLVENRDTLQQLAANFHMLVVKNLVVLEKFISMVEEETRFWRGTDKRLRTIGARINTLEKTKQLESKY